MKKSHSLKSLLYTLVVYACTLYLIAIAGCAKLHAQNIPVWKETAFVSDSDAVLIYIQGTARYGKLTYQNPQFIRIKNILSAKYWGSQGNSGGSYANFLGTKDNADLRIRTNNVERMRILSNGNIGF